MASNPVDATSVAEVSPDEHAEMEAPRTETGLEENVAGALAYVFGIITGLLFYLVERENAFVRFHAAQSIAVSGLILAASIGLSIVGVLVSALLFTGSTGGLIAGSLVSLFLTFVWLGLVMGSFGLWVYLIVRAYQGRTPRIPIAAPLADRLV